ncbi:uncharacterized protein [Ambystoma mexicanum]|uniref:uncharacterized protein n=1 Tax=Ambystoma mexicanum TaxID=8296 RepID=UPI0037E8059A
MLTPFETHNMGSHLFFKQLLEPSESETFNNLTRTPVSSSKGFRDKCTEPRLLGGRIAIPTDLIPDSGAWPAYTTHTSDLVRRLLEEDRPKSSTSNGPLEEDGMGQCGDEASRGHAPERKLTNVRRQAHVTERITEAAEPGVGHRPLFITPASTQNAEELFASNSCSGEPLRTSRTLLFCRKKNTKAMRLPTQDAAKRGGGGDGCGP